MPSQRASTTSRRLPPICRGTSAEGGFSLVELMVGLTVGLIVILVVTQTLAIFEGQKRTTTSGSDAQQSGLLGLFSIEQDVRQAGAGFNGADALACTNFFSYLQLTNGGPVVITPPANAQSLSLIPVLITDGGTGPGANSDQISVRTGATFTGSVPSRLLDPATVTGSSFKLRVERTFDFAANDIIVVAGPPRDAGIPLGTPLQNCTLMKVTAADAATRQLTISVDGNYPAYNMSSPPSTSPAWPTAYPKHSVVFRIGNTTTGGISSRAFSIDANQNLQVVDSASPAAPGLLASGIVNIQAQYGRSAAAGTKDVTSWVDAIDSFASTALTAPGGVTDRQRIKAIRVSVVARSSKREPGLVTTQCTAIDSNVPPTRPDCACQGATTNYGPCAWRDIDDTAAPRIDLRSANGDTEWQHYRYKVYQTTIPLRNAMWAY